MQIVYHHRTQCQGAEGVHIRGIVNAFQELDHHVSVISPPGITVWEQKGPIVPETHGKLGERSGFNWGGLWKTLSDRTPQFFFEIMEILYNVYSYFAMKFAIRRIRPDFIYDRYSLFSFASLLIAQEFDITLFVEVNDATIIKRSRPLVCKRLAQFIERRVFHGASVLITISEYFKQLIVSKYPIPASKICVIQNAVDPRRFLAKDYRDFRKEMGLKDQSVLGVVGAFVPWHGIDFLIESVENLLKASRELQILLVGDGPVRGQITKLIKERGLEGRVKFTGFVRAADVPKYISCMDICLMPDSNPHGSPIKIFEYMAMGKPIIAPRYGPIEEIIQDGKTGILFKPRDKDALSRAVKDLLDRVGFRNELGANAKEYVFNHHTWTINAQRLTSLIRQCSDDVR